MERIEFRRLRDVVKGCPRRSVFTALGIGGREQYHGVRKSYIRERIADFTRKRFSLSSYPRPDKSEAEARYSARLAKEGTGLLISNFEHLISAHDIEVMELSPILVHRVTASGASVEIEIEVDALGAFEGRPSLFKIVLDSQFHKGYALELACGEELVRLERGSDSAEQGCRLIVLKLGNGDYREVMRNGDRTKKGALRKKGLGSWASLREEAKQLMGKGIAVLRKMKECPELFDRPRPGSCGTCPYHNLSVEFLGSKVTCCG